MKKIVVLSIALLTSKLTLANHGIEAIGSAITALFFIAIGICSVVGIIAAVVAKRKKALAFFIGFLIAAFLMILIGTVVAL